MADRVNMNSRQLHWQKHINWISMTANALHSHFCINCEGFYVWFAKLSMWHELFLSKFPYLLQCNLVCTKNVEIQTQSWSKDTVTWPGWQWEEGNNPENVMTSSDVGANAWIIINAVCYSRKSWCLTLMQGEAKHCKAALDNHTVQQEMTRSKASDTWAQSFIAAPGRTKLLFTLKHIRHAG